MNPENGKELGRAAAQEAKDAAFVKGVEATMMGPIVQTQTMRIWNVGREERDRTLAQVARNLHDNSNLSTVQIAAALGWTEDAVLAVL